MILSFQIIVKVISDDVEIRFSKTYKNGDKWEPSVSFNRKAIHEHAGIRFKTPAYQNANSGKSVKVDVYLVRKSDGKKSNVLHFKYEK